MSDSVIEVRGLSKTFRVGFRRRRVEALKGVDFDVRRGEIVGLIGHNGAGKTTTMKILTGLTRHDGGDAKLFGQPIGDRSARYELGYLPENPYFYEHLTGEELLHFYGRMFGMRGSELEDRSAKLIEQVGLSHAADRQLKKYSKGMRQRIGIAQALINDPELVILDEPQSGLDPIGRAEVRDMILELHAEGKTILLSTHILPDVEALADRVVLLARGKLVAAGTIPELTDNQVEGWEVVMSGDVPDEVAGLAHQQTRRGDLTTVALDDTVDIDAVLRAVAESDAQLHSVNPRKASLEEMYLESTREAGA